MPLRSFVKPLALVLLGLYCAPAAAQGDGPAAGRVSNSPHGLPAEPRQFPSQPTSVPGGQSGPPSDGSPLFRFGPSRPADGSAQGVPNAGANGGVVAVEAQRTSSPARLAGPTSSVGLREVEVVPGQSEARDVVQAGFQMPANSADTGKAAAPVPSATKTVSGATEAPMPLAPRGRGGRADGASPPGRVGGLSSLLTVGSGLAMVLGLFFVVAWFMRRTGGRASSRLPTDVVEILGHSPLTARQQMHLLRCGSKLLLVCVTPDGAQTLTEITDPDEVTRLAGLCRQAQPQSATAAFRQVFQQFQGDGGRAVLADDGSRPLGRTAARGRVHGVEDHHG